jgi:hypothetical protein
LLAVSSIWKRRSAEPGNGHVLGTSETPTASARTNIDDLLVPEEGVEPTRSKASADFESAASASSATPGHQESKVARLQVTLKISTGLQ